MTSILTVGRSGRAFRRGILAGAVLGATTLFAFACEDDDGGPGGLVTPAPNALTVTVATGGGDALQPGSGGGVARGTGGCPSPTTSATPGTAQSTPASPTAGATNSAVAGVGVATPTPCPP